MRKRTSVTTYVVPESIITQDGRRYSPPAVRLDPQPFTDILGRHGSDETKREIIKALSKAGFDVRSVNFTPSSAIAYVSEPKKKKKEKRSAKGKLPKTSKSKPTRKKDK